jgi:hypothetical protein
MALSGAVDDAFETLAIAIERGFRDADLMASDVDLTALHEDLRWPSTLELCRTALTEYLSTINTELYELYRADQSDRRGDIDWSVVGPRDEARLQRTRELIDADQLHARDDFVHAAFIFQHGDDPEDFRTAHELALKAVSLDSTYIRARWIAAAAKDRYLLNIGQPQIYGTQFRLVEGVWELSPIDTTAVTDEERERWGVPPLSAARARAKADN